MNIQEAKTEIKRTISLYLEKDENGEYRVPVVRQRPIFLVGAPGIGKTAIMEQIASEMDIALVSYSMTHHTRQSAIGLPYLAEKEYEGRKYTVSEYTMSEIIASMYDVMAKSEKKEGILFLDEINCVSETLSPSMLLFLQYKRFGNEQVPEGWVVVTAGNPPQYNKSVKEFDVVTLDRLKYIAVEENYQIWKQYASSAGIHPAILAFLDMNPDCFYQIQASIQGTQYVTARGWEDLSTTIRGYERLHYEIGTSLIFQYITEPNTAREFSAYYALYKKYRSDYCAENIFCGQVSREMVEKARHAAFDERLSLISFLKDSICEKLSACVREEDVLQRAVLILRKIKKGVRDDNIDKRVLKAEKEEELELQKKKAAGSIDGMVKFVIDSVIHLLSDYRKLLSTHEENKFSVIQKAFSERVEAHEKQISQASKCLANTFEFIRKCWGEGHEMVLFTGELTIHKNSARYIAQWGSPDYYQYNQELLVYDRDMDLKAEIKKLLQA